MWCKVCHYGSPDYEFNHCGHCGGTDMVKENPFTEARKNPHTLSTARKQWEKENKKGGKGKKQDGTKMKEEIADITRGDLKSRDYETFA